MQIYQLTRDIAQLRKGDMSDYYAKIQVIWKVLEI